MGMNATSFLFLLADDIGWADFGYNGGTARTPKIDAFARAAGSVMMMDFHSGGTVCSPTRASILTGRTHFRDCVNYVFDCSDMTEGVPNFEFAPRRTFTVADAVHLGMPSAESFFGGKWHLGSLYNDSEAYGGLTSSPRTHGFDGFNCTVEVAPTATTNHQCRVEWNATVDFGHYDAPNHCAGGPNPGGGGLPNGCCFNYWWHNDSAAHAVTNFSLPTEYDDAQYLQDTFTRFLSRRAGSPFLAQISFHNCHIPFIGAPDLRASCASGETCKPPVSGAPPYTDAELDFYSCLTMLDGAVGDVLDALSAHGYRHDTMVWFTTDNGPEVCAEHHSNLRRPMHPTGSTCSTPLLRARFSPRRRHAFSLLLRRSTAIQRASARALRTGLRSRPARPASSAGASATSGRAATACRASSPFPGLSARQHSSRGRQSRRWTFCRPCWSSSAMRAGPRRKRAGRPTANRSCRCCAVATSRLAALGGPT